MHRCLYLFLGDIADVISLDLTNRYFWSISYEYSENYFNPLAGSWAGKNLVFVGDMVLPDDYPPDLIMSAEEPEELRKQRDLRRIDRPLTLYVVTSTSPKNIKDLDPDELVRLCEVKGFDNGLAYHFIKLYLTYNEPATRIGKVVILQ